MPRMLGDGRQWLGTAEGEGTQGDRYRWGTEGNPRKVKGASGKERKRKEGDQERRRSG